MNILIVGLVKNPQLKRIQEEGGKRGHVVEGCYVSELVIDTSPKLFEPSLRGKSFDKYDLVYFWALGKRRWEWYLAAEYLNKTKGIIVVNKNTIDRSFNYSTTPTLSYLKQFEEKLPFPRSTVVFSYKSVDSVIENFKFPVILKTSTGHQGKGVFLAKSKEELVKLLKDNKDKSPSFIIREFIPNDGDIRVFCVGYKSIGAMKRSSVKKGEFRSNISLGGRGSKYDLEKYPEVKRLAEKAAEITRTEIAGVDIMLHKKTGDAYILEVNPGPQFTGLEKYTGTNAALEIVKYFESLYKKEGSEPAS